MYKRQVVRFLPQHPSFRPEDTLIEALLRENGKTEEEATDLITDAKNMMTRLGITDFNETCGHLSGGQKKRLALISVLLTPSDILILDEPTNHLDGDMAEWLEEVLKKRKNAVIMVTHDRYFLDRTMKRIFAFEGDGIIRQYEGNYSDYLLRKSVEAEMLKEADGSGRNAGRAEKDADKEAASAKNGGAEGATDKKSTWDPGKRKLKFSYKEQKEYGYEIFYKKEKNCG